MYAIHGKHLKVSEKLIISGSDVTIKDKVCTIMHDSCTISCDSVYITSECVCELQNHNQSSSTQLHHFCVGLFYQSGKTPVQMAEETDCLEIVELIKRHNTTAHDPNVSIALVRHSALIRHGMWAGSQVTILCSISQYLSCT